MSNYKSLLDQKTVLDAQIAEALKTEKAEAINKVRELVRQYDLTSEDLQGPAKTSKGAGSVSVGVAKYRDPATGVTWTGRGKPPNWILGKDRAAFLIPAA